MTAEKNRTTNIMVVDDTIANLKLLEGILGRRGYRVRSFPRGRLALAAAVVEPPDLILLDINIPEMNGYEMCQKLKANPDLERIPVIFISALNEMLDKVKAFGCGGVDYISKPFQIEEILARVENHVKMRRLQMQLEHQNARLDESARGKSTELAAASERFLTLDQAKDDFLTLIAQELHTPPRGLANGAGVSSAARPPGSENAGLSESFYRTQARLSRLAEDALLLTQIQRDTGRGATMVVELGTLLRETMEQAAGPARVRHVVLPRVPDDLPPVSGHARLIQRAVLSVLETAISCSGHEQAVTFSCQVSPETVQVALTTSGPAIPADVLPHVFEGMAAGQSVAPGIELSPGLPLARRIVSLFGGDITVENDPLSGIKLTVRFKCVSPAESGQESS